jgi:hypothetical protein
MKKQIIILTLLCLVAVSCEKKSPGDESEEKYEGSGLLEHEVKEGDTNPPYIETFSDKLRGIYVYNTYETLVESSFYCSKTNKVYKPHELEYGNDINFSISINTVTIKDSCFINELVITKAIASDVEVPLKVNPMPTSILEGRNYIEKYPYISNKTELQECLYNNTDYSMTKSLVIKKEDFKGEHYFFFIAGSDSPKRGLISIKDIRTERIDWKNLNGENIYFTISSMVEK